MLFLGDYASKQTSSKQEEQVNILVFFLVELANSQLFIDLIMIYNDTEAGSLKPEHSSRVFHLPKDNCFKITFPKESRPLQLLRKSNKFITGLFKARNATTNRFR